MDDDESEAKVEDGDDDASFKYDGGGEKKLPKWSRVSFALEVNSEDSANPKAGTCSVLQVVGTGGSATTYTVPMT